MHTGSITTAYGIDYIFTSAQENSKKRPFLPQKLIGSKKDLLKFF